MSLTGARHPLFDEDAAQVGVHQSSQQAIDGLFQRAPCAEQSRKEFGLENLQGVRTETIAA